MNQANLAYQVHKGVENNKELTGQLESSSQCKKRAF